MTRFNNKYPYTDFHELNADWLLETVKDAADTVDGYDDRLTSAEGAITTLQSEVETAGTGLLDRMTAAEDEIGTLVIEVETPSTGLLDRMTAVEGEVDEHDGDIDNIEGRMVTYDQNFIDINNQFISDQGRISALETYRTEAQVKIGNLGYSIAPLFDEDSGYNAGDYVMSPTLKLHRARVNIMPGTADIHDLTQFQPTDINNALYEGALPLVTSADAGKTVAVDANGDWVLANGSGIKHEMTINSTLFEKLEGSYIDCGLFYVMRFKVRALAAVNAYDNIFQNGPVIIDGDTHYIFANNSNSTTPCLIYVSKTAPGYINSYGAVASGATIECTSVVFK